MHLWTREEHHALAKARFLNEYAWNDLLEYWIVGLADRQLETHQSLTDASYTDTTVYAAAEAKSLHGEPVAVVDLLP